MSKKAKKAKPSTALARRPKPRPRVDTSHLMRLNVHDPNNLLLPDAPAAVGVLSDDPSIGTLGMGELKLTKEEERELATSVNPLDVLIKPTGQPYLPHRVYTQWLIRAFGRFGWALVPRAKPVRTQMIDKEGGEVKGRHLVLVPYLLHVHSHPVAFAWGEQEYNETNAEQTYGDATESTVASGLRRCAKRIGIGLELWDTDWLQRWRDEHAVQVQVTSYGNLVTRWRRKNAAPLPYEKRNARHDGTALEQGEAPPGDESRRTSRPPAGNDGSGNEKITQPQRQRLATIASKAGRSNPDVQLWLKGKWKVTSSKDILRKDYDAICRELEAKGPLSLPGDGAPE